nr:MAG TPA: hypothetical protein [Caudoviricetes sp.]
MRLLDDKGSGRLARHNTELTVTFLLGNYRLKDSINYERYKNQ